MVGYQLESGGVRFKLDVQCQRDGRILDVAGQGGWRDNFHGQHMCIAPLLITKFSILELTKMEMQTLSKEKAPWKIVLRQKALGEKVPPKYPLQRFDLTGIAYSAGDCFF